MKSQYSVSVKTHDQLRALLRQADELVNDAKNRRPTFPTRGLPAEVLETIQQLGEFSTSESWALSQELLRTVELLHEEARQTAKTLRGDGIPLWDED